MNLDGVSGVASSTALTASTPCKVDNCRSYAHALPPLCTCPRVVIRVSSFSLVERRSLTLLGDILFRSRSCAPSATITIVFRFPSLRCCDAVSESYFRVILLPTFEMISHIWSSQSRSGGLSGMKMKSAPVLTPAISASHPQCLPMTSITKAL